MNTDMPARTEISRAVNAYLDEECTNWEVQDRLHAIADATEDETAQEIAWTIWWLVEDYADYRVVLKKNAWDGVQRLLLVLVSGGHIVERASATKFHREEALEPFFSVLEIKTALCRAPDFRKRAYRRGLDQRRRFPWPLAIRISLPRCFEQITQRVHGPAPRYGVIFPA